MNEQLKKLYHQLILQHSKQPFQFEKKPDAQHQLQAYNPSCGDKFTLFFDLNELQISNLHFHGHGCAISKASTSVLVQRLQGLPLSEVRATCEAFLATFEPDAPTPTDETFLAFQPARSFPGRLSCATLAWTKMLAYCDRQIKS